MQNLCILLSTLFAGIQLKSTRSTLTEENPSSWDYRWKPLSEPEYSEKVLNEEDEERRFGLYKGSRYSEDVPFSNNEIQIFTNVELFKYLLNRYLKNYVPHQEIERKDLPTEYTKRALTMLSRWKPFQISDSIGGNRRHVIRSSLISRSDPLSKLQIMGRPFRWG